MEHCLKYASHGLFGSVGRDIWMEIAIMAVASVILYC